MTTAAKITNILNELEHQMRKLGAWQAAKPTDDALASREPFSIDTLQPEQWLQWIFIAKIRQLIELNQPLPKGFEMSPYFSEVWKERQEMQPLLLLIESIEKACQ